jgi:hypothetical protein
MGSRNSGLLERVNNTLGKCSNPALPALPTVSAKGLAALTHYINLGISLLALVSSLKAGGIKDKSEGDC